MRVQLYGLTLCRRRVVSFGANRPRPARRARCHPRGAGARCLATRGASSRTTRRLVAEVAELEHKARRQDVWSIRRRYAAFYAERLPAGGGVVRRVRTLARGRGGAGPRVLHRPREALMRHAAASITEEQFPETLAMAGADAAG